MAAGRPVLPCPGAEHRLERRRPDDAEGEGVRDHQHPGAVGLLIEGRYYG